MNRHASLALIAAMAAAWPALAEPVTVTVFVFNFDYSVIHPGGPFPPDPPPDDPTIRIGDTIRWQRVGGTHDVKSCTGTPEQFQSHILTSANPTYTHTYTNAGTFVYYCTLHGFDFGDGTAGGMEGKVTVLPPSCPADVGTTGGLPGQDGVLDNNDFVAFIDLFFGENPAADIGRTGGVPGADGAWDNNDLVVFIDRFFAGCP